MKRGGDGEEPEFSLTTTAVRKILVHNKLYHGGDCIRRVSRFVLQSYCMFPKCTGLKKSTRYGTMRLKIHLNSELKLNACTVRTTNTAGSYGINSFLANKIKIRRISMLSFQYVQTGRG